MVLSQENIAQVDKIVLRWSDAQGPSYCNLSIKGGSVLPDHTRRYQNKYTRNGLSGEFAKPTNTNP